mgnify:CR=1 FL=1
MMSDNGKVFKDDCFKILKGSTLKWDIAHNFNILFHSWRRIAHSLPHNLRHTLPTLNDPTSCETRTFKLEFLGKSMWYEEKTFKYSFHTFHYFFYLKEVDFRVHFPFKGAIKLHHVQLKKFNYYCVVHGVVV